MNTNFSYYEGFDAGQFAEDAYFQQWVISPLPQDELFWNTYFELHQHQQETILMAYNLVKNGKATPEFDPLNDEEKLDLKQRIMDLVKPATPVIGKFRWTATQILKVAAVIGGLILLTATFLFEPKKETTVYQLVEKTSAGETKNIVLPDSSLVILNANSSLTYSSNFTETESREVKMEGNAFFNIRKKVDGKTFQVHVNGLNVTVLGTEFNVNARNKETEVILASGKVKLSDDQQKLKPVFMKPGDKVDYDTALQVFTKSTTEANLYQAWINGSWNFSSTSLEEISKLINAYYGVDVVFTDPKLKSLKINGVIPVTNLQAFTNIISKTLDATITQKNNQLIIQR